MENVSLQDLQKNPAALLDRVEAGEHLLIVRGGHAVAEISPVKSAPRTPRPFGLCAGAFDVADDFDTPLPDDFLRGFEGR